MEGFRLFVKYAVVLVLVVVCLVLLLAGWRHKRLLHPSTFIKGISYSLEEEEFYSHELEFLFNFTLRDEKIRTIMLPARLHGVFSDQHFEGCRSSNCTFMFTDELMDVFEADLIVIEFHSKLIPTLSASRIKTVKPVVLFGHESPAYSHNRWKTDINNFNATMTYSRDSTIFLPYSYVRQRVGLKKPLDYTQNKTKGVFAYVSNCDSMNYRRLQLMKHLSKYIDVDIYGGCTRRAPCSRGDTGCEAKLHSKYRFYLAFENSLCQDYITEKFWKTLNSPGNFVPVAMGGLSVDDYVRVAPPDSFIHVYNFTSTESLGKYLQHLMKDDAAYNRYHRWKSEYFIDNRQHEVACSLCELAFKPEVLHSNGHRKFADEWNSPKMCRSYS